MAMDQAWEVVAGVFTPQSPAQCLLAVRLCFSNATSCIGVATSVSLVDSVLGALRGGEPIELCEWHPDLARAAAVLAIALAYNLVPLVGDTERAQQALGAVLRAPLAYAESLESAYSALCGVVASESAEFAEICAQISPVPVTIAELLYVLYALYRARLQSIRDAEARLGCGAITTVDASVEFADGFVHAACRVGL